jgi:hypothetical protein
VAVVPIALPIVWAIVATIIALLLYRTSKALFDSESVPNIFAKQIRLTGSVVIAGLAFLGMKWSTPEDFIRTAASEHDIRLQQRIDGLIEATRNTETSIAELAACTEMSDSLGACSDQLRFSREKAMKAREQAEKLIQ